MTARAVLSLVAIAIASGTTAKCLVAQSDSSQTSPRRVWLAASVTLAGHILGGGIEGDRWRVGPELARASPGGLTDGQLHERLVALTISRLFAKRSAYVKAGFGGGRRWTDFSSVSAPFVQFGAGVVAPPRGGVRFSVDITHSAATPAGQYPYSVFVGVGLLLKFTPGS